MTKKLVVYGQEEGKVGQVTMEELVCTHSHSATCHSNHCKL